MGAFSADISKFVQHAKENADKATRLICYDLFSRVMKKRPLMREHYASHGCQALEHQQLAQMAKIRSVTQ